MPDDSVELPERRIAIVEPWHHWDGFMEGIVSIDGALFHAWTDSDVMADEPRQYEARSLFLTLARVADESTREPVVVVTFSERELPAGYSKETR